MSKKQSENGSASVIVIAFAVMAMALCAGLLAVAESQIVKKQVQYGAQASANAGAFVYGQTYITELNRCIKEAILEDSQSEETGQDTQEESDTAMTECDHDQLIACAESDFETCEVDMTSCFSEGDSPILTCQQDPEVLRRAADAARESATAIAHANELTGFQFNLENSQAEVQAEKTVHSLIPRFGKSGVYSGDAKSKVIISESGGTE